LEIAEKWLALTDLNGNGTIDFFEFSEFVKKLEAGENFEDKQLQEMFDQIDTDGNGELSLEEFSTALFTAVTQPGEEDN